MEAVVEAAIDLYAEHVGGKRSLRKLRESPSVKAFLLAIGRKSAATLGPEGVKKRASSGGTAKSAGMNTEQRKEHALKMLEARRDKKKAMEKHE